MAGFYDALKVRGSCPDGCRLCEDACVKEKGEGRGPLIRCVHLPEVGFHSVVKCNQCSEPACRDACPTGAIVKGENDGVVRVAEEKCVGCGMCVLACPYGGIVYNPDSKKAVKSDMCGGEPRCVKACKPGVLTLAQIRPIYQQLGEDVESHGVGSCAGCGEELSFRFATRVLVGAWGRNMIFCAGAGCYLLLMHCAPEGTCLRLPTEVGTMTNMPAVMTGVKRYYRRIGRDVNCVVFAGDGSTADVGFGALSGAAERGENLLYICLDNEAYMNTGIQRSGTTPRFAWTTTTPRGKRQRAKNIPLLMATHGVSYVATATIAFPEDFTRKLLKAAAVKDGFAYVHLLCPCPTGWRAPEDSTIEISKRAVETNYFPLWEYEDGKYRFTYRPAHPRPIADYLSLMGRFSSLGEQQVREFQEMTDEGFALLEALTGI